MGDIVGASRVLSGGQEDRLLRTGCVAESLFFLSNLVAYMFFGGTVEASAVGSSRQRRTKKRYVNIAAPTISKRQHQKEQVMT